MATIINKKYIFLVGVILAFALWLLPWYNIHNYNNNNNTSNDKNKENSKDNNKNKITSSTAVKLPSSTQ